MGRHIRSYEYPNLIAKAEVQEAKARVKARQRSQNSRPIHVAPATAILQKSADSWAFASERALEDFVYDNLESLLGLKPLIRQHNLAGEICDILAIAPSRQLTILELKNTEDRGIVQQLTRYYSAVREAKPFAEQVDYEQPIRLMTIAPSFHRHNWIDREHSTLQLEFCQFEIIGTQETRLSLQLQDLGTHQTCTQPIPREVSIYDLAEHLPEPPRTLDTLLQNCKPEERDRILAIRRRILCFDERIQEIVASPSVKYGRGKANLCAEIRSSRYDPIELWLYLPIPSRKRARPIDQRDHEGFRHPIGRMRVGTTDFQTCQWVQYKPSGKQTNARLFALADFKPLLEQASVPIESDVTISDLVNLALAFWQSKNA